MESKTPGCVRVRVRVFRVLVQMLLLEMTDFLWFLSGLLQIIPGAFFEKINGGVNRFGGAVFGIPNWGSRRYQSQ